MIADDNASLNILADEFASQNTVSHMQSKTRSKKYRSDNYDNLL